MEKYISHGRHVIRGICYTFSDSGWDSHECCCNFWAELKERSKRSTPVRMKWRIHEAVFFVGNLQSAATSVSLHLKYVGVVGQGAYERNSTEVVSNIEMWPQVKGVKGWNEEAGNCGKQEPSKGAPLAHPPEILTPHERTTFTYRM